MKRPLVMMLAVVHTLLIEFEVLMTVTLCGLVDNILILDEHTSLIFSTSAIKMELVCSSKRFFLKKSTQRYYPEDQHQQLLEIHTCLIAFSVNYFEVEF